MGNLMAAIPLLLHGASSSPVLLLVGDDLKVLQLSPFHQMVHQKWRFLVHLRLQISSDLLQVQQSMAMFQELLLLPEAEKLCATSATVVGTLLHNVRADGPCY